MGCAQGAHQDICSKNGNIHVQTNQNDDKPELEDIGMVSGGKPTLQRTTIDGEIMAQQSKNHDNDGADASLPNDTSKKMQRAAHAKNQTTATMEATQSCHSRTSEYWEKEQRNIDTNHMSRKQHTQN